MNKKLNDAGQAGTTAEQRTKDECLTSSPAIANAMLAAVFCPTQFRIGNFLKSKEWGGSGQVEGIEISKDYFEIKIKGFVHKHEKGKYFDLEPIKLSRDWMLKFGFDAFPWGWVKKSKDDFGVRLNLQSFSYDVSGNNPVRLQFVHQLQNLFYCLTGEELQVVANGS